MPEQKYLRFFVILLYIAFAIAALWFVFNYVLGWVAPFIIGFIISRIIEYPVKITKDKLRLPRPLGAIIYTVLFYGIIGTGIYFAATGIFKELIVLFDKLSALDVNSVMAKLNAMFINILSKLPLEAQDFIYSNVEGWLSSLVSTLQKLIGPFVKSATNVATSLPSVLIFVIASIVSTYFFSCDYATLRRKVANATSEKWRTRYVQTKEHISNTLVSYIRALLVLICITFVELAIGLSVLRIQSSVLLAAIIAIIDALPILGTGWVLMPWAVFSLLAKNYKLAIGLPIIYAVVVVVRNMIEPKIVGEHIGLHPLITLISMYIGLKLFGIVGMFMPIPVALIRKFYEWGYFDFLKHNHNSQP